ncbi:hypothetical protein [Ensifer sp. Root423]|uniref:hypothetical protein n=1 Tax=Ensifer sp. Root423 TaxID=1736534 RepID=UPI0012E77FB4|nr:hypothetical protein [Ensifer sp. Root423]
MSGTVTSAGVAATAVARIIPARAGVAATAVVRITPARAGVATTAVVRITPARAGVATTAVARITIARAGVANIAVARIASAGAAATGRWGAWVSASTRFGVGLTRIAFRYCRDDCTCHRGRQRLALFFSSLDHPVCRPTGTALPGENGALNHLSLCWGGCR